jgi:4'-phosphopantetheinyl transferase
MVPATEHAKEFHLHEERCHWFHGARDICLRGNEVHVWRTLLDRGSSRAEKFWSTLTADERRRAERFRFDRDRRDFVSARGVLRDILGRYLRKSPAEISFFYNNYGKPAVSEGDGPEFNLSHSQGAALYAFAWERELGVDLELLRDDKSILAIAQGTFSASEVSALRSLSPHQQLQGFFSCWTRKEAYIKALGEGLTHPLDSFTVTLGPHEHPRLVSTSDDPQPHARWSLVELNPFPGYTAALAVSGTNPNIHYLDW